MSDTTDLSIIIILMVLLTLYIYYVRKTIDAKYDINNIKCNPINLFLKSINAEPEESIDNFAECVQLLGPHRTNTAAPAPAPVATKSSSIALEDFFT